MPYTIELLRRADKVLGKLARSQPDEAEAIERQLDDLADNPRPPGAVQLTGYPGVLRVRVGDYRICYQIEETRVVVLVVVIGRRDEVYEQVKRYLGR